MAESPIGRGLTSKQSKKIIAELFVLANKIKAGRPLPGASRILKKVLNPKKWWQTLWGGFGWLLLQGGFVEIGRGIFSASAGASVVILAHIWPDLTMRSVGWVADKITDLTPLAVRLSVITMNQIFGDQFNIDNIVDSHDTEPHTDYTELLGREFTKIIPSIFSLEEAQKDFASRTRRTGSVSNRDRYFGTNLSFQLRSLTIGTVSSIFGWSSLRHLEGLHQSINWAFGFGWLSWTVMGAIMDITTTKGLKEYYNKLVKPNDYTLGQVYDAVTQGRITDEVWTEVSDNAGERDDIRPVIRAMNEKRFDEQDVTLYYQHGWMTEADVTQWARWQGFEKDRAKLKTQQITLKRQHDLLIDITEQHKRLYRDCVIEADQLRTWLKSQNYTDTEVNLTIALEELTRRERKFLTLTEQGQAIDFGLDDFDSVYQDLLCQGYTEEDALTALLVYEIKHVPKDCLDKIKPGDIAGIIRAIIATLGLSGFLKTGSGLIKLAECLGGGLPFLPGPPEKEPKAPAAPHGNFALVPSIITAGDQARITWRIVGADPGKISLDGEQGLPDEGIRFIRPQADTIYRLEATGPGGTSVFLASALVRPARPPKPERKEPRPAVSLSVSPGRATEVEQIEVRWSSTNAEEGFLDTGAGPRPVATYGALIMVVEKSTIMTFTATGPGGSRSTSDALIVIPLPPTPNIAKPPTASLAISPGRAHPDDLVEVSWSTSNATRVLLNVGTGERDAGVVGSMVIPAFETVVMVLTATGPGGTRQAMDALIVTPLPPVPPPTEPLPHAELAIAPARGKKGTKYEVRWRTSNAQSVTLQRSGEKQTVVAVGAREAVAEVSDLWILTASGPGGVATAARVFIVV